MPVKTYQRLDTEQPITFWNRDKIESFYDLNSPKYTTVSPRMLCNLLIHSFVFLPDTSEDTHKLDMIYFNSDRTKDDAVFEISLNSLFKFIDEVANDEIEQIRWNRKDGFVTKSQTSE